MRLRLKLQALRVVIAVMMLASSAAVVEAAQRWR